MGKRTKTTLPSGRPSICHWSLTATFAIKEQAAAAVQDLIAEEVPFDVSFRMDLTETSEIYVIEIGDMPWAENLKTAARILRRHDHRG